MNDKDHYSGDDEAPDRITNIDELIEHIIKMFSDDITEEKGSTVIRGFTIIGEPGKNPAVFGFKGHREIEEPAYEEEGKEGNFYIYRQEPFIDVYETDDNVVLLADLGVEEKCVEYEPCRSHVEISIIEELTDYSRTIGLPCDVNPESMTSCFRNGVLELTFERAADVE